MDVHQPVPSCSSSLDPLRNNSCPSEVEGTAAQRRLFARHWSDRTRIILALRLSGNPYLERRSRRVDGCRFSPSLERNARGNTQVSFICCRDRLCPLCQADRGRVATARIGHTVRSWPTCRFATLTLRHREEPLADSLNRLATCFRRLRTSPFWKTHVKGGVWSVEVTRNLNCGTWHAHVHLLFNGDYIPQKQLSDAWLAITGDSPIVDIRAVPNRDAAAKYIVEYVSKPFDVGRWQPSDICEFAKAMHGRRLLHTFGSAHGTNVDHEDEESAASDTTDLGQLSTLARAADLGHRKARHAMEILRRMGPLHAAASGQQPLARETPRVPVESWEVDLVCNTLVALEVIRSECGTLEYCHVHSDYGLSATEEPPPRDVLHRMAAATESVAPP